MSYGLFSVYGIELEYMIVDSETLDIRPLCDRVLAAVSPPGEVAMEVERGDVAWSNELALHVIEMKTNGPASALAGLAPRFQANVLDIERILSTHGARLLPSAMHPWMDPEQELKLWPHEADEIYRAFDRVFDCRGHGWSNLQSMHINFPFSGDDELGRLHAAIRVVLPLLPALAASSPYVDGRASGNLDHRLAVYKTNARKVPSISGCVIPERVFTQAAYERELLAKLYRDIAPHDPEGILQYEWLNARGAIARFDRMAIEIRLLDIQEQPAADLAIAELVSETVRGLVEERWSTGAQQRALEEGWLADILSGGIRDAEHAAVPAALAELFGLRGACEAGALWRHLAGELELSQGARAPLGHILERGPLARRLMAAVGTEPSRAALREVYGTLADCLRDGRMFVA